MTQIQKHLYERMVEQPGKFENEPSYVPYFWEMLGQGFSNNDYTDENGYFVSTIDVSITERLVWPELKLVDYIELWESEEGDVYQCLGNYDLELS